MDDLISRQAALDAIHCDITVTGRQNAELVAATIGAFADRIKALPPVQPEILASGEGELNVPDTDVEDMISRQAVIDLLKQMRKDGDMIPWEGKDVFARIRKLPSAQPEQPPEIQDILNYLDTVLHPIISPEHWDVYSELHDMISSLPSAQPEIIRCKECKKQDIDNVFRSMWCYEMQVFVKPNEFCSRAERRTDEPDR